MFYSLASHLLPQNPLISVPWYAIVWGGEAANGCGRIFLPHWCLLMSRYSSKKRRKMPHKKNFIKISPFCFDMMQKIQNNIIKGVITGIRLYQKTFSPDHGILCGIFGARRCRFFPSCSEYAIQSLRQYGLVLGIMSSIKRIVRCNPFCVGGYDPAAKNNYTA